MTSPAQALLAADGAGCLLAAGVIAASTPIAAAVLPSASWRPPVALALCGTGAMLLVGAARSEPTSGSLTRAAAVNVGWVGACCLALSRRRPRWGTALIAGTALFDGVAATLQWRLRDSVAR